jgi:hypothetical protein
MTSQFLYRRREFMTLLGGAMQLVRVVWSVGYQTTPGHNREAPCLHTERGPSGFLLWE